MLKVYIGTPIAGIPLFLDYAKGPVVECVSKEEADYLLIPHNWTHVREKAEFLLDYQHPTKKTIIFWIGDRDEKVEFPNAIVFRTSGYKSELAANEIIMPTDVEDLGAKYGIVVRTKMKESKPSVGFVGWARQTGFAEFKTRIKNFFLNGPHKKGVLFRIQALRVLGNSELVDYKFVIRDSYKSGSQEEYAQNIQSTDLTLCPKGDGNYSARFYEVLSLGRLPILIDTDVVLPLEGEINYDEFMVRVPYTDIARTAEYVKAFWDKLGENDYRLAQEKARTSFENHLRLDVYLRRALTRDFLQKYEK